MTTHEQLFEEQERDDKIALAKQVIENIKENKEDPHLASIDLVKLLDEDFLLYVDIIKLSNILSSGQGQEDLGKEFELLENRIKKVALEISRQGGFDELSPKRQELEERARDLRSELRMGHISQDDFTAKEQLLEKEIKASFDSSEEGAPSDFSRREFYAFLLNKLVALKIKL